MKLEIVLNTRIRPTTKELLIKWCHLLEFEASSNTTLSSTLKTRWCLKGVVLMVPFMSRIICLIHQDWLKGNLGYIVTRNARVET